MTSIHRRLVSHDAFSRRMLIPGLIGLGALTVAILLLPLFEYLSGRSGGTDVMIAATIGGVAAIVALVAVQIANVRLIRTADVEAARMHAMMTAMTDGVCCIDEDGLVTYMNPAAERMLGRRYEHHARHTLATVFPLRSRGSGAGDEASPLLARVLAGESYAGRDEVVCGDGSIMAVDVRLEPIMLQGELAGAVLAFADDTDRSREEQAKDDFVGFASHELRSPLTAMLGFSSWLAKKLEHEPWRFDPDTAEAIAALASETGRMESIIELFLDLTQIRMDRLNLEPDLVDLTKLLREEGAAVRSRYPAAAVTEVLPEARVLAIMDEQRLRQTILNLLDNAAKYGGPKPNIVVSLAVWERRGAGEGFRVGHSAGRPAAYLRAVFPQRGAGDREKAGVRHRAVRHQADRRSHGRGDLIHQRRGQRYGVHASLAADAGRIDGRRRAGSSCARSGTGDGSPIALWRAIAGASCS